MTEYETFKEWIKKRLEKGKKRQNLAICLLVILTAYGFFIHGFKMGCEWNNVNNYYSEHFFTFKGWGFDCMSLEYYDDHYKDGLIRECLDQNPEADLYNCVLEENKPIGELPYNLSGVMV